MLLIVIFLVSGCVALLFVLLMVRGAIKFTVSPTLAILSVLLVAGGTALIFYQDLEISKAITRQNWPTTKATIIESKVIGERASNPKIRCRYNIDGRDFILTTNLKTPGFGRKRSRRQTAEIIVSEYGVGSEIKVFYNPKNPQQSCIRTGPYWTDYMKLSLGVLLFGLGLIGMFGYTAKKFI